jgi:hypothetical protein
MKHVSKPNLLKRRLHRWIKTRIDPCLTIAIRTVPSINFAQFCGELFGRRSLLQGRVTLTITEDHQPGRIGPSPKIRCILRRIHLRPAVPVADLRRIWIDKRQPFMARYLERLISIDETSVKTNMAK